MAVFNLFREYNTFKKEVQQRNKKWNELAYIKKSEYLISNAYYGSAVLSEHHIMAVVTQELQEVTYILW